jgi:hypothetical protein
VAAGTVALVIVVSQRTHERPSAPERPVEQQPVRAESRVAQLEREPAAASAEPVGLAEMSDRFRYAAMHAAIRDAGFVCDVVVDAVRSAGDVWIASCSNMINYRVDVTANRSLVAQPVASYFDKVDPVGPVLDDRFRVDRDAPLRPPSPFPTK